MRALVALAAVALFGAGPAASAGGDDSPKAIARLEPGLWELKSAEDSPADVRRLCVSDLRMLLQPLHEAPLCRHFLADDAADHVTITYDCAARGQGHTSLRVETPRLVQIDSQGVANGAPFARRLEGRRVASCEQPAH